MSDTQQSFIDMSNWMFATGSDWPNQSPPNPPSDDDELYLSTKMFGKGAYLNPVSTDSIQKIQNQMVANMVSRVMILDFYARSWTTLINIKSGNPFSVSRSKATIFGLHGRCVTSSHRA